VRFTAIMLMLTNPEDGESSYTLETATIERHSAGFCVVCKNNARQMWFPDHIVRQAFWVLE